mgnify:FL=1
MLEELKNENVKFKKMSEEEAIKYLEQNNNYRNICLYKNLFEKYYIDGKYVNKYIDLDFAYLKDLAIIDFELRLLLYDIISDIEHYLKFRIINLTKDKKDIVKTINGFKNNRKNIKKKNKNITCSDVDEFLDKLTFGDICDFYSYIIKKYHFIEEKKYIGILKEVVALRNRVYHNDKILANINDEKKNYTVNPIVLEYLKKCRINKEDRTSKMSNSTIRGLTCVLYMFDVMVSSDEVKLHIKELLNKLLFVRIVRNKRYYSKNKVLKSVYKYFRRIILTNYKIAIDTH